MAKQKIRIRLKAYDHRILDQSAERLLKRQNVLVPAYLVRFRCQLKNQFTQSFVRCTNTKILVSNLKCVHINV